MLPITQRSLLRNPLRTVPAKTPRRKISPSQKVPRKRDLPRRARRKKSLLKKVVRRKVFRKSPRSTASRPRLACVLPSCSPRFQVLEPQYSVPATSVLQFLLQLLLKVIFDHMEQVNASLGTSNTVGLIRIHH